MTGIKGKEQGRRAQQEFKAALAEAGFFVIGKGISTPGTDIIALDGSGHALFVEVKATVGNTVTINYRQVAALRRDARDYMDRVKNYSVAMMAAGRFPGEKWALCMKPPNYGRWKVRNNGSLDHKGVVEWLKTRSKDGFAAT